MDFKILNETQARELPGFIRPDLLEDDMSDYFFYIAEDERGILGMAVIDPVLTGPELLSIAVIPSALRTGVGTQLLIYVKRDLERMLGMQEKGFDTYALFALMTPAMAQQAPRIIKVRSFMKVVLIPFSLAARWLIPTLWV